MSSKQCTACEEIKPLEMFPKEARSSDGRDSRCKACRSAYGKLYRERNREKIRNLFKERFGSSYQKPYRERYREKDRGRKRRYRAENPDADKAQKAVWTVIRAGRMPKASTLQCLHCPDQAAHYHHHKGYEPKHWLDVIPLCQSCHYLADSSPAGG